MESGQIFILCIIAIGVFGGVLRTQIRVKNGYPPEDRYARRADRIRSRYGHLFPDGGPEAERKIQLLSSENERLTGQISRLEERIAVLERIATDPAERVSREIDALR